MQREARGGGVHHGDTEKTERTEFGTEEFLATDETRMRSSFSLRLAGNQLQGDVVEGTDEFPGLLNEFIRVSSVSLRGKENLHKCRSRS